MGNGRQVRALTRDNVHDLRVPCRGCTRWELDPVRSSRVSRDGSSAEAKAQWLSSTLLEWGSCGQVIYVDDQPIGYITYAPPAFLPGLAAFPTTPVSPDAVGLGTVFVDPNYRGHGYGRILVQSAAADLVRRQVRAIEVVAHEKSAVCMVPAEFLRAVGFSTVRAHLNTPRLRLDLRSTSTWREDVVEAALDRILKLRPQLGTAQRHKLN